MYLKFSAHAYFRTRNSNLKSVSNINQLEISRNLIRDNRIVSKQFRTLIYFYILNYVMFTGKIKFNYLVIKVVLSTVIKGQQKRVDLFKDHKIDLEIIMTINLFLVSIDQILIIIIGNVLVFANRVTYLYWRAQYSINPVFINRTP